MIGKWALVLQRQWYRQYPFWPFYLLYPLTLIYRFTVALIKFGYRLRRRFKLLFRYDGLPVPVIIVGNITVGGTGKTPFVIALAHYLKSQGLKVGIVSRGYTGTHSKSPIWVEKDTPWQQVGEEAILLKQHTGCPVVVGRHRVEAARYLLHKVGCEVMISDDGLQHHPLNGDRAITVAMVDGARGVGNGYCLPLGPLREPILRLNTVDYVMVHAGFRKMPTKAAPLNTLNRVGFDRLSSKRAFYTTHYQITYVKQLKTGQCYAIDRLSGKVVHAVAGIGNPNQFFKSLGRAGCQQVIPHIFPDHHHFTPSDLDIGDEHAMVIMTEKDAVKCLDFIDQRHWAVGIELRMGASDVWLKPLLGHIMKVARKTHLT